MGVSNYCLLLLTLKIVYMKNKIIFLIAIFISVNSYSFCQDTINNKKNFIIKFSPFLLLGDYITASIGIPIGIEFKINKKLSFDQNFSYIFGSKDHNTVFIPIENMKGIRSDSEFKRYLNNRNNFTGFYLASHILYQYTNVTTADWVGHLKVYRNLFAIHEKVGWQYISKKGFVFDVAIGFGPRYITSKSSDDASINFLESGPFPWSWHEKKPYEYGSKWYFGINGSFKLGWAINLNKKNKV